MIKEIINKFNSWNKIKQDIELINKNNFHIRPKEIWYINMGKNIGFESNGKSWNFKRPVLVIKKVGSMYFIVSMTTKGKGNIFYHKLDDKYFNKSSYITISQVKVIDKKRFIEKIGKITMDDLIIIKNKLKQILF